jgi:hypothetical protein
MITHAKQPRGQEGQGANRGLGMPLCTGKDQGTAQLSYPSHTIRKQAKLPNTTLPDHANHHTPPLPQQT